MGDNIRNDGANMGGDLDSEFHSLTEYLMTTLKDQECGPAPVPITATALQAGVAPPRRAPQQPHMRRATGQKSRRRAPQHTCCARTPSTHDH